MDYGDLGGLQLDTRLKDTKDPYGISPTQYESPTYDYDDRMRYTSEKQARSASSLARMRMASPSSRGWASSGSINQKEVNAPYKPTQYTGDLAVPRICGLQKRYFWVAFGLLLSFIITAAVVGGVVGGLQAQNNAAGNPPWYSNGPSGNSTTASLPPYM